MYNNYTSSNFFERTLGNGCKIFVRNIDKYANILAKSKEPRVASLAVVFREFGKFYGPVQSVMRKPQPSKTEYTNFRSDCKKFVDWARNGLPNTFRADGQVETKENIFQRQLKFHILETHLPDFMEAHGTVGLFSEQSLEAYGQRLKRAFNDRKGVRDPEQQLQQVQGILDATFKCTLTSLH